MRDKVNAAHWFSDCVHAIFTGSGARRSTPDRSKSKSPQRERADMHWTTEVCPTRRRSCRRMLATGMHARRPRKRRKSNAPQQNRAVPSDQFSSSPMTPHFFAGRARGGLTCAVGAGKSIRLPSLNRTGLYSSGTLLCINGLFWYRSMSALRPWVGELQSAQHSEDSHEFADATQFRKP